jgi:hypothetical protein
MDDNHKIGLPVTRRLAGTEAIRGTTANVESFSSWAMSEMCSNVTRSMLAEYLVALAVGGAQRLRVEWDAYDVLSPEGFRIEVKASAYLQA